MWEMLDDVAAAGLRVRRVTSILPGISPMCYLEAVSQRAAETENSEPLAAETIETILERMELSPVRVDEGVGEATVSGVFESTAA
mgnify:CR=1 FL=1